MSIPDAVVPKLADAAARLERIDHERDAAFEALKEKHGGPTKDPDRWIRHMEDMALEVMRSVPDPWAEISPSFDAIADAWLAAPPPTREEIAAALASHRSLVDGHFGYVALAQRTGPPRDAPALRRVAAVVAMGRGGRDYRDAILTVEGFVRTCRAAGIDPTAAFEEVAALAPADDSFGYGRGSTRDALLRFARTK